MSQSSRFILLPAIMLLSLVCFGQKNTTPKLQAGVRVGYNYADFTSLQNSTLLSHQENKFIMVGAFAQVRVFKKFGLRAEILSNPKGALVNYYDGNNVQVEAVRKLNYTDVTFSAIYNFRVLKLIGLYAFAGYGYESLNSAKDAIKSPYTSTKTVTANFEKNAQSLIGGLGLRMRLGKISILPEFRYLYGLTDVINTNVQTKNRVITASVGLSYALN